MFPLQFCIWHYIIFSQCFHVKGKNLTKHEGHHGSGSYHGVAHHHGVAGHPERNIIITREETIFNKFLNFVIKIMMSIGIFRTKTLRLNFPIKIYVRPSRCSIISKESGRIWRIKVQREIFSCWNLTDGEWSLVKTGRLRLRSKTGIEKEIRL